MPVLLLGTQSLEPTELERQDPSVQTSGLGPSHPSEEGPAHVSWVAVQASHSGTSPAEARAGSWRCP